jgi:hypothetical protein
MREDFCSVSLHLSICCNYGELEMKKLTGKASAPGEDFETRKDTSGRVYRYSYLATFDNRGDVPKRISSLAIIVYENGDAYSLKETARRIQWEIDRGPEPDEAVLGAIEYVAREMQK